MSTIYRFLAPTTMLSNSEPAYFPMPRAILAESRALRQAILPHVGRFVKPGDIRVLAPSALQDRTRLIGAANQDRTPSAFPIREIALPSTYRSLVRSETKHRFPLPSTSVKLGGGGEIAKFRQIKTVVTHPRAATLPRNNLTGASSSLRRISRSRLGAYELSPLLLFGAGLSEPPGPPPREVSISPPNSATLSISISPGATRAPCLLENPPSTFQSDVCASPFRFRIDSVSTWSNTKHGFGWGSSCKGSTPSTTHGEEAGVGQS